VKNVDLTPFISLTLVVALALIVTPAMAQEKKAPAKKKPVAVKAHGKATPEQIRKFNELQTKQAK
jgi:hypothetical protein